MDPQVPPPETTNQALEMPISPQPRHGAFIGPDGLRAGWKFAIFLLAVIALVMVLVPIAMMFVGKPRPHTQPPLKVMLAIEIMEAVATLIVTGFLAKVVDRKPWGYFGMPLSQALGRNFWLGAITGFGALAFQLTLMHLGGWYYFGPLVLHGADVLKFGATWGLLFLCTGLFEEGLLRGYPQRVLTDGMGFWPAAILLSLIFGLSHLGNGGENPFGIFMVCVDGMTMCFALWRTGNMWFGIGNHAAWDWAQTFFFGTPDSGMKPMHALLSPTFHGPALLSGGSAGPEGSVLVLLSEALIALFVAFAYPRRQYPRKEDVAPEPDFSASSSASLP
jgi:membrane protease YdiL (CAAX protease family)